MSCRHSLALGTCRKCYPATGTLDPTGTEDSLDGPGAVPRTEGDMSEPKPYFDDAGIPRCPRCAAKCPCIRVERDGTQWCDAPGGVRVEDAICRPVYMPARQAVSRAIASTPLPADDLTCSHECPHYDRGVDRCMHRDYGDVCRPHALQMAAQLAEARAQLAAWRPVVLGAEVGNGRQAYNCLVERALDFVILHHRECERCRGFGWDRFGGTFCPACHGAGVVEK